MRNPRERGRERKRERKREREKEREGEEETGSICVVIGIRRRVRRRSQLSPR